MLIYEFAYVSEIESTTNRPFTNRSCTNQAGTESRGMYFFRHTVPIGRSKLFLG